MQWIEVSVPTRSDEIDDVCAQLAELGAGGMVVEDETDFQQFWSRTISTGTMWTTRSRRSFAACRASSFTLPTMTMAARSWPPSAPVSAVS